LSKLINTFLPVVSDMICEDYFTFILWKCFSTDHINTT